LFLAVSAVEGPFAANDANLVNEKDGENKKDHRYQPAMVLRFHAAAGKSLSVLTTVPPGEPGGYSPSEQVVLYSAIRIMSIAIDQACRSYHHRATESAEKTI
jgi:hypothetical protein